MEEIKADNKIGNGKMLLSILAALVILIVSQLLATLVGSVPVGLGISVAFGNALSGVLYPVFAYIALRLWIRHVLKQTCDEYMIPGPKLKPVWCAVSVLLPCAVSVCLVLTGGSFIYGGLGTWKALAVITGAIFFYGIGTGIVEEMVFRGLIMNVIDKQTNRLVAIIIPSVLFGTVHILGAGLDALSTIQLLLAGSMVGVMFSLVVYESQNIWNSAIIHSVWNMIMIGGIFQISDTLPEDVVTGFVLDSNAFWITGGDFGVETSVIAFTGYFLVSLLAWLLIRRKVKNA